MIKWFRKVPASNFLTTDVHSHLIPGIDDGSKTLDESLYILNELSILGFRKVITTPHIISNHYANTPEIIREGLNSVRSAIRTQAINLEIEAAAEYYVDDAFRKMIDDGDALMTFGDNLVLIETGFMNQPLDLADLVFKLKSNGYHPVLAHPERYQFLQDSPEKIIKLRESGLLFQINVMSMTGHYSKAAQKIARFLIDKHMVDLLGSDIHHERHLQVYKKAVLSKLFQSCRQLSLLNHAL